MRNILFVTFCLFVAGCSKPQPAQPIQQPVQPVQPAPPAVEQHKPDLYEVPPSDDFLRGYWDGYSGTWLGPFSWTFDEQYRRGHQIGAADRHQGREPRYPVR